MKRLLCILLLALGLFSCDSYLEENPDDRKELKTVHDAAKLVANSYNQGTYLFIEWMTDNVTAISDNTQREHMTEAFTWSPMDSYESQESPTYFWENAYYAIAHCNEALAVIDELNGDEDLKAVVRGEALISRAYNHFLLVNVFSKHYSPNTAADDLGIPYVDEVEDQLFKNYPRGTVKEVYEKIESDLTTGLSLLKDDYFVGSKKYHFTRKAAYAFAARFYLFKKDYLKSLQYCDLILDGNPSIYVRNLSQIYQGTNFDEMASKNSDVNEISNLIAIRKETFYARANYGYRSSNAIFDIIYSNNLQEENDIRDQRWSYNTGAIVAPKYNELFRYTTSNTGFPYFIQNELKGEEVLLNRMECHIMNSEFQKALDDYHVLAIKRYESGGIVDIEKIKAFYSLSDTKNAMIRFLLDERRKEFLDEGLRWFDIKRFELPITHIDIQGNEYQLIPNDIRTAVQLPESAIANGITPNPR
ncbi:RagB/SusD family nutrient uptake outer membrane protein [Marinifilum caeruleilacunae]|uniref:RagB/SusD family nutrient uptake outer membrane protein n=1 Tax=Marinifilum caeruleilacunae TaxID=2499076 RepID=A0ABX1WXK0_9BACT|nr:RagB/SusD family nutrient uptake outer membrane protein [Marinifilum caeruleilacunae]NOU60854.1 RagB/SusD family nutrient uptake outer membrane protein [Marinifilum caeruleilacunae]